MAMGILHVVTKVLVPSSNDINNSEPTQVSGSGEFYVANSGHPEPIRPIAVNPTPPTRLTTARTYSELRNSGKTSSQTPLGGPNP